MKTRRLEWPDIAKGITIILMILGHADGIPAVLRCIIFSFHMPLFMITNGYFIKKYDIKRSLLKSAKTLLLPYAVVCVIQGILNMIFNAQTAPALTLFTDKLLNMVGGFSFTSTAFKNFGSVWVIWFVCCLFVARNLYIIIKHFTCRLNIYIQWLILAALACAGYFLGVYVAFLPWSLDIALVSLVFIGAGDALARYKVFTDGKNGVNLIIFAVSLVIWIVCLCFGLNLELATRSYPLFPLTMLEAVAGSIVVLFISKWISLVGPLTKVFSWFGRHSLILLSVHCMESMFIDWNGLIFSHFSSEPYWLIQFLIKFIFIVNVTIICLAIKAGVVKLKNKLFISKINNN